MNRLPYQRIEALAQLALIVLLAVGCWLVLRPFFSAILFAIVVAVSSWPAYQWLLGRMRGRQTLASLSACLLMLLLVAVPAVLLVISAADGVAWLLKLLDEWLAAGPPPAPASLARIPLVGHQLQDLWNGAMGGKDWLYTLLRNFAEPAQNFALASGRIVGSGLLQVVLAVVLLFFLYRDGTRLGARLDLAAERLGGAYARDLLATAQRTVTGVMFSVIGTGLAQAMVAVIGFAIAGVPGPILLGAATFVLSMVPVGPPIIWAGAALWLLHQGEPGWAVFMVIYGFFGISSVDNVIKPFLISRSSHLPFAITLMGVVGGVLAFGVVGIFLGPTLLALGINLATHWLAHSHNPANA